MSDGRRAVVLAAGRSTRLHPLTAGFAKPALPFVGEPILGRVLDGLAAAGVEEAIVNLHHAPESVREVVARRAERPPRVSWSDETDEILGTGGALVPLRDALRGGGAFYLVNGDCIHSIDYRAILDQHRRTGASATLAVRPQGREGFGALIADDDGIIRSFGTPARGKPGERHFLSVQVIAPALLDTLPTSPRSFSSFAAWYPGARERGHAFRAYETDAEWHAVDTPPLYLDATRDFLAARGAGPFVAAGASVDRAARLDAASAVHEGCAVAAGARLISSVLLPGASVGAGAVLERCIVGFGGQVAAGARLSCAIVVR